MLYTLFFNRYRDDRTGERRTEYEARPERLMQLVTTEHPGFVDIKSYIAEDGERLTVVRFEDRESLQHWRLDAEHLQAQERGRSDYYVYYRTVTCEPLRERAWPEPKPE